MTTENFKKKLSEITQNLISEKVDYFNLKNAIDELKSLLEIVSEINNDAPINSENIALPTGHALGTKWAGMCLEDMMRTYAFVNGIHKAVKKEMENKPKKPVSVLYAGTGPYATLILALLSIYKPSELQLILLEINPISIKSLKRVIKGFGFQDYVKAIYHCDAANFIIPSEIDAEILIIECMQRALVKEPQVSITYNLLSQMKKEVILIPENISLHLTLINSREKTEYQSNIENIEPINFYEKSEAVFTLNKEEVIQNSSDFKKEGFQFPEKETHFSKEQLSNKDLITISTEITIFENISLNFNESGLTIPLLLADLNNDQTVIGAKTQYIVGPEPELKAHLVRS